MVHRTKLDKGIDFGFFGHKGESHRNYFARIEDEINKKLSGSKKKKNSLSSEITNSLSSLSDALNKSNAEWINVEKNF